MKEDGGPAQPSPSIRAALNGGYRFLRVQCSACKQRAYINLEQVKRRPGTAIWTLDRMPTIAKHEDKIIGLLQAGHAVEERASQALALPPTHEGLPRRS